MLRPSTSRSTAMLVVLFGIVAAACTSSSEGPAVAGGPIEVVATTSILGDITANVLMGEGTVEVLIPAGADPHDYQASARQMADLQRADLVVANGIGLEEGMIDVLDAARSDGVNILFVGESIDPLPFHADEEEGHETSEHDRAGLDPHFWLDLIRLADATQLVADELTKLERDIDWQSRADAYAAKLLAADAEAADILAGIPSSRRKLVTNHDSLGYFAARYGFEILGTVIPGGGTLADPSSAELAELVAKIRREDVPAIFAETTEADALARSVAAEAGASVVVVELFTGSLGEPGSGADTVIGMVLTNARRIAAALA